MELLNLKKSRWGLLTVTLTSTFLGQIANALPNQSREYREFDPSDPFAVLDPQNWVNPDNMTWADWKTPPGTDWSNPAVRGSVRNFNIALVVVDYSDLDFSITEPIGSTIFTNPQPTAPSNITRAQVPSFYRDFLNSPNTLNKGHTLHEYWMGDSAGRFGVDLTAFGAYRLPSKSFEYGIDNSFNAGECPTGSACNRNIRTDALAAWRADIGTPAAAAYELVFILSAGQDESSTWQEFGEMLFQSKEDVPDSFGPPVGNFTHRNYAKTRYVEWSSWAAAATIWPNAGSGSSTQAESSGMGTYAHELSHLLSIGDNYNNPYSDPPRRAYTGPWSMMSRGSFNGPGGPHTRWQIPPLDGGSMGSYHTVRDKLQLGLAVNASVVILSREALADSGLVVARIQARSVVPGPGQLMGLRVRLSSDLAPACDINTDPLCDGRGYNNYEVEVVDRMGADSFQPDSGVMISKSKNNGNVGPFQWTIDANPQDIRMPNFYRPNGTLEYITIGDYRQLADALFHAGTRSGSEYEYVDAGNSLHFYIIDVQRDAKGILSYTIAVRSPAGKGSSVHGVSLTQGQVAAADPAKGMTCSFQLDNTGAFIASRGRAHPQNVRAYLNSDVYRLNATVDAAGWTVVVPNALSTAEFGKAKTVQVAVSADASATQFAVVKLTAVSESDPSVVATSLCRVRK